MDESSSPIELLPREPIAEVEGIKDPFVVAGGSGSRSNTLPAAGEINRTVPLGSSPSSFSRSSFTDHVCRGCLNNLICSD